MKKILKKCQFGSYPRHSVHIWMGTRIIRLFIRKPVIGWFYQIVQSQTSTCMMTIFTPAPRCQTKITSLINLKSSLLITAAIQSRHSERFLCLWCHYRDGQFCGHNKMLVEVDNTVTFQVLHVFGYVLSFKYFIKTTWNVI